MRTTLRILMASLGLGSVAIALSIIALGAGQVAALGEGAFNALSGTTLTSPPWSSTMDSELRFYAALFAAFGALCVRTARQYEQHAGDIPWLALTFFAGGIGRAISWVSVGAPHPFFLSLMAVELILPPVIIILWKLDRS